MRLFPRVLTSVLALSLTGCALISPTPIGQVATPATGTLPPAAQVDFIVQAPAGTPTDANLTLVLLDPATDLGFNTQRYSMEAQGDGRWSLTLTPAVESLLYYRYELSEPGEAIEVTAQGVPVDFRTAYITGPGEIQEIIARWSGEPYVGEAGRALGQIVSSQDGQPLNEMVVSAGGHLTFTDGEGRFRIDDLSPGLHTFTVFSPTGSYRPRQQQALIAANTTTPIELSLRPSDPVVVTFQVTVPADTPEESVVRLTGNVTQLGFRFRQFESGTYQSIAQMPSLVRVDPEHYLGVFTLYEGTNLHYKYTLGDGIWNAERSATGAFVTRSVTLEGESPTLRDEVAAWGDAATEPVRFEVAVPDWTPSGDVVAIQFKAGSWRAPLPMWPSQGLWTFALYGPEFAQTDLEYRFCRNMQCGTADEAGFAGKDASGRPLDADPAGSPIQEVIEAWQWLDPQVLQQTYPTDPRTLEYTHRGGFEFTSSYDPSWPKQITGAFSAISETGANEVILTPAWTWVQSNPFPVLELVPTTAPFNDELREMISLGRDHGLRIALRPTLNTQGIDLENWWEQAIRNQLWWDLWFEEYRSFVLTYASVAQQMGVEKLIIGGPEVIPALPFGSIPDGSPSGVPVDSEARWRELLAEVRERFAGQLIFELEVQEELSLVPPFIELFDMVHLFWHSPVEAGETTSDDIRQATIEGQLNEVLDNRLLAGKPVSISLAYLSLEGSSSACPPQPDGSCRPLSDFSQGSVVDIDLDVDLEAQAEMYAAFIQAIADEPQIQSVYARGFYPPVILHDKSLSVYGKPAEDVLRGAFQNLEQTE